MFETYEGFPAPTVDGHPIDLERAQFALEYTAKACLGDDHQVHLHSFGVSGSVGAQLLLIAAECEVTLRSPELNQQRLGVDVYGVYVSAYTYYKNERSLQRLLRQHPTRVILQNRAQAA